MKTIIRSKTLAPRFSANYQWAGVTILQVGLSLVHTRDSFMLLPVPCSHLTCNIDLTVYPGSQASQVILVVKNSPGNARDLRDTGLTPGSGRSPRGGYGNSLQYSSLENPMDREAWPATDHRVSKSWTRLKQLNTHTPGSQRGWWGLVGVLLCSCFLHPLPVNSGSQSRGESVLPPKNPLSRQQRGRLLGLCFPTSAGDMSFLVP